MEDLNGAFIVTQLETSGISRSHTFDDLIEYYVSKISTNIKLKEVFI